jgi:hypothetical protein
MYFLQLLHGRRYKVQAAYKHLVQLDEQEIMSVIFINVQTRRAMSVGAHPRNHCCRGKINKYYQF